MARQHVASQRNHSTSGAMCQMPGWLCGSLASGSGLPANSQAPQSFGVKADSTSAKSVLLYTQESVGDAKAPYSFAMSQMAGMQVIAALRFSGVWQLRGSTPWHAIWQT